MSFPYIFTFYSFKGGVGRSMAAANVAYALASRGRHVLLVDMDLEAPGLSTFFHKSKETEEKSPLDILDILGWALDWADLHPGEKVDFDAIAKEGPNLGGYSVRVAPDKVPQPRLGEAGRLDLLLVNTERDYLKRFEALKLPSLSRDRIVKMSRVLWGYFKSRRFPREVPDYYGLAAQPQDPYDYVLVDSRTGLTEIGALCIGPLADRLVVFTGLNVQNVEGTAYFLKTVGVTGPLDEIGKLYDKADPAPSEPDAPPRLGPKPTLLVASPVPVGEADLKKERMRVLAERLNLTAGSVLSYHSLLALHETVFVRDFQGEHIAREYRTLADRLMAMVRDHAHQLVWSLPQLIKERNPADAVEPGLRLALHDPSLGEPTLQMFAGTLKPGDEGQFMAADRMYRILASERAHQRWVGLGMWGRLLARWAEHTRDKELRTLRLNEAIVRLTEVLNIEGVPANEKASALLDRSHALCDIGDRDRAIADCTAVTVDPDVSVEQKAESHLGRGILLREREDPDGAIADLTVVIDHPASTPEQKAKARNNRGLAFRQKGRPDRAIADCTAVIADPGAPPDEKAKAYVNRALAFHESGQPDKEIADHTAVIDNPDAPAEVKAIARVGRALGLSERGEFENAIKEYTSVVNDPAAPVDQKETALMYRGVAKQNAGDTQGAIADFNDVLDMPDVTGEQKAAVLVYRGVAKGQAGDTQGAIADANAVLDMPHASAAGKARALVNRAWAKGEGGDTQGAIVDYTAVLDMPDAPAEQKAAAYASIGWEKYVAGELDVSVATSEQALCLKPDMKWVHANLGLALLRLGRTEEGLEHYRQASAAITQPAKLDDLVADLRDAMKAVGALPGADAALEMVDRRKKELAGSQQKP